MPCRQRHHPVRSRRCAWPCRPLRKTGYSQEGHLHGVLDKHDRPMAAAASTIDSTSLTSCTDQDKEQRHTELASISPTWRLILTAVITTSLRPRNSISGGVLTNYFAPTHWLAFWNKEPNTLFSPCLSDKPHARFLSGPPKAGQEPCLGAIRHFIWPCRREAALSQILREFMPQFQTDLSLLSLLPFERPRTVSAIGGTGPGRRTCSLCIAVIVIRHGPGSSGSQGTPRHRAVRRRERNNVITRQTHPCSSRALLRQKAE